MIERSRTLAVLATAGACAGTALAATGASGSSDTSAVAVNVRIEGIHRTLFEGRVLTTVHEVDSGDGSGPHKCDGTNGGANPKPGPTLLGAFDDATKQAGIAWHGSYSPDFQDFTIDKVGPDASDTQHNRYWGQALNFKDTQLGGCQIEVRKGDRVLIAFDSYAHPKLELSGPRHAKVGHRVRLTVIDGESGKPVEGARIGRKLTDANGRVRLVLNRVRTYRFKARKPGTIRSNRWRVRVRAG